MVAFLCAVVPSAQESGLNLLGQIPLAPTVNQ
jgi:hypothetical protein